jgi:hypothetical protein
MSFKKYALTAVFAAAVGAGGTVLVADRYIEHKMSTGQPCDVYKGVTNWMDRYSPHAQKEGAKDMAGISYSEETLGNKEVKVCSATAGEAHGKDLVDFVHQIKGLFQ